MPRRARVWSWRPVQSRRHSYLRVLPSARRASCASRSTPTSRLSRIWTCASSPSLATLALSYSPAMPPTRTPPGASSVIARNFANGICRRCSRQARPVSEAPATTMRALQEGLCCEASLRVSTNSAYGAGSALTSRRPGTWKKSPSTTSGTLVWWGPTRMVRQEAPTMRITSVRRKRRWCAKIGLSTHVSSSARCSSAWCDRFTHLSRAKLVESSCRSTSTLTTASPTTWPWQSATMAMSWPICSRKRSYIALRSSNEASSARTCSRSASFACRTWKPGRSPARWVR
mmetsp:Transcript_13210/g.27998  ORF Transcript_13210/g.27998 Transcript_13210/m.27998 type:complete len:287 (-) Transcript_13210:298-1158(-)